VHAAIFEVDQSLNDPDEHKHDAVAAEKAREQYLNSKSGPLTVLPNSLCYTHASQVLEKESYARLCQKIGSLQLKYPPDELKIRKSRFVVPPLLGQLEFVFHLGNWNQNFSPDLSSGKKYATCLTMLQYPFSKGSTHIKPSDLAGRRATASDAPLIDPKYLQDDGGLDAELLAYGVSFADRIAATQPLAGVVRGRVYPETDVDMTDTEGLARSWVVQNVTSDFHPVGTCAMGGRSGIERGVVDERLKVYGVKGVRVVDASIMPLQISAHLQATVYAIAEKGAAMIQEDMLSSKIVDS